MKLLCALTMLAISCTTMKPAAQTGFLNRTIISEGREYRYVVYVPREFNASRKWPVLLALHGGGERGSDGPTESRKMNEALIAAGADVRYTEFPDANHNAWDPAYGMPELWQWMLAQRR